jgi:hypothetical protein
VFSKEWFDTGKLNKAVQSAAIASDRLIEKNIFTVTPIQAADKKAIAKASVATKYIGFGEGIAGSSTEEYRKQAGEYANPGNYSSEDIIFVSIGGKRGSEGARKVQQDKTIREALKAIEAGATLITDNKAYVDSSSYNEGEKRLAKNLEAKGYSYSEQTVNGEVLGVWTNKASGMSRSEVKAEYSFDTEQDAALAVENNDISTGTVVRIGNELYSVYNKADEDISFTPVDSSSREQSQTRTVAEMDAINENFIKAGYPASSYSELLSLSDEDWAQAKKCNG